MPTKVGILRTHRKDGTTSLHLTYNPPLYDCRTHTVIGQRKTNLFVYDNPKSPAEKQHNRDIEEMIIKMQTQQMLRICNEEYGFLDKSLREGDFIQYFEEEARRHDSNPKWDSTVVHFKAFCHGKCTFGMIGERLMNDFRHYLLNTARNSRTHGKLNQNTAAGYFVCFRSVIKRAYNDKKIEKNYNDFVEDIKEQPTEKPFLTQEEFKRLAATPCKNDVLRRASIFAVFSGLRISDILDLKWEHIVKMPDGGWAISKVIVKTQRREIVFISDEALEYCGERGSGTVFRGLSKSMTYGPFKRWIAAAGIEKNITFHCLRHTSATLMYEKVEDLWTVAKQLTHKNVSTTQIYTGIVDEKKRRAANAITLRN